MRNFFVTFDMNETLMSKVDFLSVVEYLKLGEHVDTIINRGLP